DDVSATTSARRRQRDDVSATTSARRQPFAGGRVGREERLDGHLGQRDVVRAAEGRQRRVEREVAVGFGDRDGEQQLLRGRVGSGVEHLGDAGVAADLPVQGGQPGV